MIGKAYKKSTKNQHRKATKKPESIPNGAELNSISIRLFSVSFLFIFFFLLLFLAGLPDKLTGSTVIYGLKSSLQGHGKYFSDFTAQKSALIS